MTEADLIPFVNAQAEVYSQVIEELADGQSVAFYYLEVALLILVYLSLRALVNSRYGLILAAIREDAARAESFGYDIRALQLIVFCIGAMLAALSGILDVSWGNLSRSRARSSSTAAISPRLTKKRADRCAVACR